MILMQEDLGLRFEKLTFSSSLLTESFLVSLQLILHGYPCYL